MTQALQEVYIVSAKRLAVGRKNGALKTTRPDDMLASAIRAALAPLPELDHEEIGDVIVGCAMPEAEQGMNVARIGALLAGLKDCVPGMTINRFCASGLQSIVLAAQRIALGDAELMIAAGTESMSLMPQIMGNKIAMNPAVFMGQENLGIAYGMGMTAENVATRWSVSRDDQDAFALESHQKALAAQKAGLFTAEISAFEVHRHQPDFATGHVKHSTMTMDRDEGPRADTSLEKLGKLKPVFMTKGSVTAGNSSQMSDGAAALVLASAAAVKRYQLTPLARFAGFSVAGVAPDVMGIGPVAAIPKVLAKTGIKAQDLDWIELNEAFAAQALAVIRELALDAQKVNPLGGAIALGHPLGATGAIRACTVVHGLRRTRKRYGMVTMCIGTGMGAAGIFERL